MKNFQIVERKPTATELFILRKSVGWSTGEESAFAKGLQNSLYGVCVFGNEEIVGTVRVIGDGSTFFYIQDVIVKPEYQRQGIGLKMMGKVMEYIRGNACREAIVGLIAVKDTEPFYEKFGFCKKPNEEFGCEMMQFWEKDESR